MHPCNYNPSPISPYTPIYKIKRDCAYMYTRTYIRARTLRRRKRAGLSRALTGWSGRRGRRERTRVHLSARACSARYDVNALDNIGVGHDTSLAHSLDRKNCSCFSYLSYLRPHVRARVLVCRRYSDEKNIRGRRFGLSFFPFSREREKAMGEESFEGSFVGR